MIYVHPTFLYESLWNLIGFILINVFYQKRKYHGEVTLWYFAWYGLGRGFIELLRTDSLMIGSVRVSSLLSFLLFFAAIPLFFIFRAKYKKLSDDGCIEYQEVVTIPLLLGILHRKPRSSGAEKADMMESILGNSGNAGFDTEETPTEDDVDETEGDTVSSVEKEQADVEENLPQTPENEEKTDDGTNH